MSVLMVFHNEFDDVDIEVFSIGADNEGPWFVRKVFNDPAISTEKPAIQAFDDLLVAMARFNGLVVNEQQSIIAEIGK